MVDLKNITIHSEYDVTYEAVISDGTRLSDTHGGSTIPKESFDCAA